MVKCCAPNCYNAPYRKAPEITFHRFPKNIDQRDLWIQNLNIKNWQPYSRSVVCSKHFEAYFFKDTNVRTTLGPGAIPTLFETEDLEETVPSASTLSIGQQSQVHEYGESSASYLDPDFSSCSQIDDIKKPTDDISYKLPLKRSVYKCNECNKYIFGYQYVCVQCQDHTVCATCEALGAHVLHYVLRVPADKPHHEATAIVQTIREIINRESDNKDLEVLADESYCINSEVYNVRDPLEGEENIVKIEPRDLSEPEHTTQTDDEAIIQHEDKAILEEIRKIINRENENKDNQEVPEDESDCVRDPLEEDNIVKIEPRDLSELEPTTQTDDEAIIQRDIQPTEPQKRRKRQVFASGPDLEATPVTLPDTQIRICLDRVTEVISKRPNTQTNTLSSQNIVSSTSQIIKEQTPSFPKYAPTNVGTSETLDQPGGSMIPVMMYSIRHERSEPRVQREQAGLQVVSFDLSPAEDLIIKVEFPD